ncbi:MAG: nucleotide sugar dehydrogenase [Desulfovibrionaceae bacterium]|nr:nucleotide sugar dehydrogenase [Desulfovibrionaceae bacterium]
MTIAIAGTGYVGLSLAVLLSQKNEVMAVDIIPEKIASINARKSPIADAEIETYLGTKELHLTATLDAEEAYRKAEFIIIATPTNYDVESKFFDTSSIDAVLKVIERVNPKACVVIKSTIPVGYLKETMRRYPAIPNMLFSPEFLREGRALYDNLHPSRIIVGIAETDRPEHRALAERFASLLADAALDSDIPTRIVHATEAECIKLFANSYLALRVAYFNELDTYAEQYGLNTAQIIEGVCLDPRIGQHYNNPSFGYGGYCLPKDTLQLRANFAKTPSEIVPAIVRANATRKQYIVSRILARKPSTVGIYRLIMKAKSDNFRQSAIQDVMHGLREAGVSVCIFEPMVKGDSFGDYPVYHDLDNFAASVDVIVANRMTEELRPYSPKVYTRDLYERD